MSVEAKRNVDLVRENRRLKSVLKNLEIAYEQLEEELEGLKEEKAQEERF